MSSTGNGFWKGALVGGLVVLVAIVATVPLLLGNARERARARQKPTEEQLQASLAEHGRKLHEVDPQQYKSDTAPAFVNDPNVLGRWETVDFVDEIDKFQPGIKSWPDTHFVLGLTFRPNGLLAVTTQGGESASGGFVWSNGVTYANGDKTLAKYQIKALGDTSYLFLEWVSGDVTERGIRPYYYVFKKAQ